MHWTTAEVPTVEEVAAAAAKARFGFWASSLAHLREMARLGVLWSNVEQNIVIPKARQQPFRAPSGSEAANLSAQ